MGESTIFTPISGKPSPQRKRLNNGQCHMISIQQKQRIPLLQGKRDRKKKEKKELKKN